MHFPSAKSSHVLNELRSNNMSTSTTWTSPDHSLKPYNGPPRNIAYIDQLHFPKDLQPKNYSIEGTHPDSRILFTNVRIIDAMGKEPYQGDVLITGIFLLQPYDMEYDLTMNRRTLHTRRHSSRKRRPIERPPRPRLLRQRTNPNPWAGRRTYTPELEWRRFGSTG
jgi:hypothetical protein